MVKTVQVFCHALISVIVLASFVALIVSSMSGCSNNAGNEDLATPQPAPTTVDAGAPVSDAAVTTDAGAVVVDASTPDATTTPDAASPPVGVATTRTLTVVFEGSPAGRQAMQRHCEGSPMALGDVRPDTQAQFKLWPDQDGSDPNTWRSFGGDVTNSSAVYSRSVVISQGTSLRFQCYDNKAVPADTSYGCTPAGVRNVRVYEGTVERAVLTVTNLVGSANCQVN